MKSLGAKTDKSIFAELRKTQFSTFLLYRFLQKKTILNYEILGTGAWERCKIWGAGFSQSRSARGKLGGGQLPPLPPSSQAPDSEFINFCGKLIWNIIQERVRLPFSALNSNFSKMAFIGFCA